MRGVDNKTGVQYKRELTGSEATALPGPDNPPSSPHANGVVGSVGFTWTASPISFPEGYDFKYTIDGANETTVNSATSPQVVAASTDENVCGWLRGYKNGQASDWSAVEACALAL